jgi:hypothetical protein
MRLNKQAAYLVLVILITALLLYVYVSRNDLPVIVDAISVLVFVLLGGLVSDLYRSAKKARENR